MLKGKAALVTGSTRGIGEAAARALAQQGCNVMMSGFGDPDEIEQNRASIEADTGVSVRYCGANLADADQVDELARAVESAFGSLDILVNNAVIRYFHSVETFERDDWNHALAVNLTAPFFLIQHALPFMRRRGWGRIVNLSSVMGLGARAGRADYITTKTGLLGLTRAVAAELRDEANITCDALCPGSVLTPNTDIKIAELAQAEDMSIKQARREYLARRGQTTGYIEPERVAKLIVFLCQDTSLDINGAAIPIDKGRAATWLE